MGASLLRRGARAAEEVAGILVGRRLVAKALNPLDDTDLLVIIDRLTKRFENAAGPHEVEAVDAALNALDVDWSKMSDAQVDAVVKVANKALHVGVKPIPSKIKAVLDVEGPKLVLATKEAVRVKFGLDVSRKLSTRDKEVEEFVGSSTTNYVSNELGARVEMLSKKARGIVTQGLAKGLGPIEIGKELHEAIGGKITRSPAYWRTVASSFSTQARSYSQIGAFSEAKISTYQFEAVLDEVTTDVCRFFHGKVFSVIDAVSHINDVMSLGDPEDIKTKSPWVRTGRSEKWGTFLYVEKPGMQTRIATITQSGVGTADAKGTFTNGKSSAALTELGTTMPPLHGNCRSMIVPGPDVVEPEVDDEQLDEQAIDEQAIDEQVEPEAIDPEGEPGTQLSFNEEWAKEVNAEAAMLAAPGVPSVGPVDIPIPSQTAAAVNGFINRRPKGAATLVPDVLTDTLDSAAEKIAERFSRGWVGFSTKDMADQGWEALTSKDDNWAHAQYAATQRLLEKRLPELQAAGIVDEKGYLTLYRGVKREQGEFFSKYKDGTNVMLPTHHLSSWSTNPRVRDEFANLGASKYRGSVEGVAFEQRVHYTRTFICHLTEGGDIWDPATGYEWEWVLINEQLAVPAKIVGGGKG